MLYYKMSLLFSAYQVSEVSVHYRFLPLGEVQDH